MTIREVFSKSIHLKRALFLLLLLSLSSFSNVSAQDITTSSAHSEQIAEADSLINNGEYDRAMEILQHLLGRYPQDPILHLTLGKCYLKSTRLMFKAIEHLKFASVRDAPNIVYFYLAEAYYFSYHFDEAISYYRRFTINGGDPKVDRANIENRLSQCENGKFMLSFIYQPEVLDRKRVHSNELFSYIVTASQRGTFVPKPESLKTRVDKTQGDSSYIFFPNDPEPGNRVVYSSYGTTTSFGKDIYMIEMQPDGRWSKPIELGETINTSLDDDFPYLASDGVTLYFASRGHYSMGGFDLYRSVYNPSTKKWGSVENLGFPISSTYNDFLFVPNDDETLATIITDRNVVGDSVDIVVIRVEENPIRRAISSIDAITSIAQLEPKAIPAATQATTTKADMPKRQEHKPASFSAVENDPEYVRVLARGFEQQMRSDSLRVQLEALRQRFDFITTAEERRNLEGRVVVVENALLSAQQKADTYFAQASHIEQEHLTGVRTPSDRSTSTFATDNPEYLYQAQFASTVFHSDELNQLERIERATSRIEALRRRVLDAQRELGKNADTSDAYVDAYSAYTSIVSQFIAVLEPNISVKKKIYSDCISVALMKRGAVDQQQIRNEINIANQHFRNATIIRNNAADDTRIQSEYEALLLDELGVHRLEIAFAKLWGMSLFEQELLSKTYRLEINALGHTIAQASPVAARPTTTEKPEAEGLITRVQTHSAQVSIDFEAAADTAFIILDKLPYSNRSSIPSHLPLPNGVVYKIQLAAFSNPPALPYFKGMYPLWAEPIDNGRITKFYVGLFRTLNQAEGTLTKVRNLGFKDAFVVAWHNGRSVTTSRAQSMEGSTPHAPRAPELTITDANASKLYFIQIGPYQSTLPNDIAQTVRAMAPGKDISRKSDSQRGFIFSVGSFDSMGEANRVKDNMVASGISTAIVVAIDIESF